MGGENIFILCKVILKLQSCAYLREFMLPPYILFDWEEWAEVENGGSSTKIGRSIEIVIPIASALRKKIELDNVDLLSQIRDVVGEFLLESKIIKSVNSLIVPGFIEILWLTTIKAMSEKELFLVGPPPDSFSHLFAETLRQESRVSGKEVGISPEIISSRELSDTLEELSKIVFRASNKIPQGIFPVSITKICKAQCDISFPEDP